MKPAAVLHIIALSACLAAHMAFADELQGVRRALETMKPASSPIATMVDISEAA